MPTRELFIGNRLGLHFRAAAKLVQVASEFTCEIEVSCAGRQVNAKSIMGLMMLAASRGTNIQVSAEGEDAAAALQALTDLIERRRFDEE